MKRAAIAIQFSLILALIGVVLLIPACKKDSAPTIQTPPPNQAQPEKVGSPTVIPKDKTPEQYVTEYYEAYKAKKFDKCYEMLPAVSKAKENKENFISVRESMPINSYDVKTVQTSSDTSAVEASYELAGQGKWVVVWQFKNSKEGWIAEGYQARMGQ